MNNIHTVYYEPTVDGVANLQYDQYYLQYLS